MTPEQEQGIRKRFNLGAYEGEADFDIGLLLDGLAGERAERDRLEQIAQFLFARLDDIDTAEDIAKSDDRMFRSLAHREHVRRFEVATTDGYTVTWKQQSAAPLVQEGEAGNGA